MTYLGAPNEAVSSYAEDLPLFRPNMPKPILIPSLPIWESLSLNFRFFLLVECALFDGQLKDQDLFAMKLPSLSIFVR